MKRMTVNILDPRSIEKALDELEKYQAWTEATADAVMYEVAQEAAKIARQTYADAAATVPWRWDPSVLVDVRPVDDGYSITADGEEVCFIEFGTGIWAEPRTDAVATAAKEMGVKIYPGDWSMTYGKQTWKKWSDDHKGDMREYPYNGKPSPGMLRAYQAIQDKLPQLLKERFSKYK